MDLTGNIDSDASIRLCIGGTLANLNAAIPSCSGGTIGDASKDTTTTWIYALSTEFITTNLTEGGTSTLILIATDLAGNHAASESATISLDTTGPKAPTISLPIAIDNFVNESEKTGFALTGSNEAGTTVVVCLAGTGGSQACNSEGTRTLRSTVMDVPNDPNNIGWSYFVTMDDITAMGQGNEGLGVAAFDDADNFTGSTIIYEITVDTVVPDHPVRHRHRTRRQD